MTPWIRRRPVALALAVATLGVAVATGSAVRGPAPQLRDALGLDIEGLFVHGRVGSLLTSVLLGDGPLELLAVLAGLVVLVGAAEAVIGSRRTLLAWIITALAGGLIGTALQAAGLLAGGLWTTPPATTVVLHPLTPVLGVLMTASAFTGPLWRRRIRLVGFAALVVLLLYSGQPGDLDRLVGAGAGLLLGVLLVRARPRRTFVRSSHHEARTLLAALVAVSAIGPVVAVVQPRGYGLLRPLGRLFRDPLPLAPDVLQRCAAIEQAQGCAREVLLARLDGPAAAVLAALPLLVLVVAAVGIARGRRTGAWLAVAVNGLLALLAAVYFGLFPVVGDPDQIQTVRSALTLQSGLAVLVPTVVAAAVFAGRRHCVVLPTRRALLLGGAAVLAALFAASAVYVGVGLAVRHQFDPVVGPLELLAELPERFVPIGFLPFRRLDFVPVGPVAALLDAWTGPVVWAVLAVAAVAVSASGRASSSGQEQARVRALLRAGSSGSLSWMATWPGNRFWFSADGRHAVAYRDGSGVALTVGEPIGDPEGAVAAARAFAVDCDDRGLVPAFYSVRPAFAAQLGGAGAAWAAVEVGEDTVIDPARFTMRGKHWQDVRTSVNRADRQGVRSVWTGWSELPIGWRTQIEAISEEWVADKRLPELGFTLGGVEQVADPAVRLMLAVGPGDRIEAVTSWLPTWQEDEVRGLTLDFMRRRAGSMNGVVEFLIAAVISAAQQRGLAFVSLSVAPLATGAGEEDDRLQRVLGVVGRAIEPAYGFRTLAAFKDKFRPAKVPQVIAFPDGAALPAIAVAVARAYLPDLTLPAVGRALGALRPDEEPAPGIA